MPNSVEALVMMLLEATSGADSIDAGGRKDTIQGRHGDDHIGGGGGLS